MWTKKLIGAVVLATTVAAGCSDKDLSGINTDCSNLLGVYRATSFTVTSTQGTPTNVDLLAADSSAFDITFGAGAYSTRYVAGGSATPLLVSGNTTGSTASAVRFDNTSFFGGGAINPTYDCKLDDDVLTLEAPATTYTFAGETEPRAARVNIRLELVQPS
jgi:hypothetical protein